MKKSIKTLTVPTFGRVPNSRIRRLRTCSKLCFGTALITITLLSINLSTLSAQTPPPPNGGQTPSAGGNNPVGGGAPIGSGLLILVAVGAGYGAKKVYDFSRRDAYGKEKEPGGVVVVYKYENSPIIKSEGMDHQNKSQAVFD